MQARRRVPPCARGRRRLGRSARARPAAVLRDVRNEFLSAAQGARPITASSSTSRLDGRCSRDRSSCARDIAARARLDVRCRRSSGTIRQPCDAPRSSSAWPTATYRVGVDIGGTFTDIVAARRRRRASTPRRSPRASTTTRARSSRVSRDLFAETGIDRQRDRRDPPRHDGRVQRDPRAQGRARRPDHHQGLPRRAGDPHAADAAALRPRLDEAAAAGRALSAPRGRRAHRRARRRSSARSTRPTPSAQVDALLAEKVEAIAVCLLHSYANPAHELPLKDDRRSAWRPTCPSASRFEVLPEIKEYERTSTTVINAYVMPIVATLPRARCAAELDAAGIAAPLLLMQSNGGLTTDAAAVGAADEHHRVRPGRRRRRRAGAGARDRHLPKIITFDMGGTTAKASMVENGEVTRAQRIRGRRRHHDRLAPAHGRRLHAEGAGDRPRGGRRRRRLACLDRRRRRAAGRPAERRRACPARSATTPGGDDADRHRRQRRARLPQPARISSAARSSSTPPRRARCSPRRSPSRSA